MKVSLSIPLSNKVLYIQNHPLNKPPRITTRNYFFVEEYKDRSSVFYLRISNALKRVEIYEGKIIDITSNVIAVSQRVEERRERTLLYVDEISRLQNVTSQIKAEKEKTENEVKSLRTHMEENITNAIAPIHLEIANANTTLMAEKVSRTTDYIHIAHLWPKNVPIPSVLALHRSRTNTIERPNVVLNNVEENCIINKLETSFEAVETVWVPAYDVFGQVYYYNPHTAESRRELAMMEQNIDVPGSSIEENDSNQQNSLSIKSDRLISEQYKTCTHVDNSEIDKGALYDMQVVKEAAAGGERKMVSQNKPILSSNSSHQLKNLRKKIHEFVLEEYKVEQKLRDVRHNLSKVSYQILEIDSKAKGVVLRGNNVDEHSCQNSNSGNVKKYEVSSNCQESTIATSKTKPDDAVILLDTDLPDGYVLLREQNADDYCVYLPAKGESDVVRDLAAHALLSGFSSQNYVFPRGVMKYTASEEILLDMFASTYKVPDEYDDWAQDKRRNSISREFQNQKKFGLADLDMNPMAVTTMQGRIDEETSISSHVFNEKASTLQQCCINDKDRPSPQTSCLKDTFIKQEQPYNFSVLLRREELLRKKEIVRLYMKVETTRNFVSDNDISSIRSSHCHLEHISSKLNLISSQIIALQNRIAGVEAKARGLNIQQEKPSATQLEELNVSSNKLRKMNIELSHLRGLQVFNRQEKSRCDVLLQIDASLEIMRLKTEKKFDLMRYNLINVKKQYRERLNTLEKDLENTLKDISSTAHISVQATSYIENIILNKTKAKGVQEIQKRLERIKIQLVVEGKRMCCEFEKEKEIITSTFQVFKDLRALQMDRKMLQELHHEQYSLIINMEETYVLVQSSSVGGERCRSCVCAQSQKQLHTAKICHTITLRSAKRIRRKIEILLEAASLSFLKDAKCSETDPVYFSEATTKHIATYVNTVSGQNEEKIANTEKQSTQTVSEIRNKRKNREIDLNIVHSISDMAIVMLKERINKLVSSFSEKENRYRCRIENLHVELRETRGDLNYRLELSETKVKLLEELISALQYELSAYNAKEDSVRIELKTVEDKWVTEGGLLKQQLGLERRHSSRLVLMIEVMRSHVQWIWCEMAKKDTFFEKERQSYHLRIQEGK